MNEILIILRSLINDLESITYSDNSLKRLIIVSALMIQKEFSFEQNYSIDISNVLISPDPTDNAFILICAHKTAILLLQSEIRSYSSQSVKVVDGPSSIDLTSRTKDSNDLLKFLNDQYFVIKKDFLLSQNNGGPFGYAVITPTTVEYISANNFS